MSDTTGPELCSPITNVCKPPKKLLTPQKLSSLLGLFGLTSAHRFDIVGGGIEPIDCLVFYLVIKMRKNLYRKPYQKWQTAVKTFKKFENVPTGTRNKRQILLHKFLVV